MICADFLAGANLDGGDATVLVMALDRLYRLLPDSQRAEFLDGLRRAS